MSTEEILAGLAKAVIDGDTDKAVQLANKVLEARLDPYKAMMDGCGAGMKVVGEKYQNGEMFIPEILLSAEAMYAVMDILGPHIRVEDIPYTGKVVAGVIEGDIHDIGKNLLVMLLKASGFEVVDLGRDVAVKDFVQKAKDEKAEIIAMSTLMTTTAPGMKRVIDILQEEGIRDKVKTIIGGAAVSKEFAKTIGADAYGEEVADGIKIIKDLMMAIKRGR
jgi:corrinoid protein of di/trimethylamine methyltransferase